MFRFNVFDRDGKPLGYVMAVDHSDAMLRAVYKWGNIVGAVYQAKG